MDTGRATAPLLSVDSLIQARKDDLGLPVYKS
jgi:hypothetical protein